MSRDSGFDYVFPDFSLPSLLLSLTGWNSILSVLRDLMISKLSTGQLVCEEPRTTLSKPVAGTVSCEIAQLHDKSTYFIALNRIYANHALSICE